MREREMEENGKWLAEGDVQREAMRLFRRLGEEGAFLTRISEEQAGLFVKRNNWRRPVLTCPWHYVGEFLRRDWVERQSSAPQGEAPPLTLYRLTDAGRAFLTRTFAPEDAFRAQHQLREKRAVSGGEGRHVTVNSGEDTLGWLRRRKGPDGRPLISAAQYEAGEKFCRDFTLGGLTPHVTKDWSLVLPADRQRRGPPSGLPGDGAMAARRRFAKAVEEVGPGLSDVLIAVCCHLQGLEMAERDLGWPRRAGKLVLTLALDRLAAHYGLGERDEGRR
ncbi:DUF6456 domain-containing protein [Tepidicaulis sp. LMO-SS28]|uniref:DUF6456 domain-containing protein n=1 Tax=Tepidicaulis sp. LMO-SS28 TaxID=3447455 RepID=UPI003EDEB9C5